MVKFMIGAIQNLIKKGISASGISKLYSIRYNFRQNEIFNNSLLDREIENFALQLKLKAKKNKKELESENIAFLATEFYEQGGHAVLARNILQNIPKNCNTALFLTKKNKTMKIAKKRMEEIASCAKIDGVDFSFMLEKRKLMQMFNKITSFSPKAIIAFMHMNDAFAAAILALLKKYADIKILFVNFAAHHPSLGMSFADLILEMSPYNAFVTQKYRGLANTHVIWLAGESEENLPIISDEQIKETKIRIGIPQNCFCTMTGCASYKLYSGKKSEFLELICRLLEKYENLCHVLITNLTEELKQIIDSVFQNSKTKNRLLIMNFVANYKPIFKCADFFIDSFPISNDLTMIDLMSLKVPFVSMINRENIIQSFNEYMPQNYPYIFENVEDLERGVHKLFLDKDERNRIAKMNYEHFLNFFEGKKVTEKILKLANCNDFSKLFCKINEQDYKNYGEPKLIPVV
jgi:hypothetical protein